MYIEGFNLFKKKRLVEINFPGSYEEKSLEEVQIFNSEHQDRLEDFTISDVNRIKNSLGRIKVATSTGNEIKFSYKGFYFGVLKYVDEWFILHSMSPYIKISNTDKNRYFICDTMDGVLQSIKDMTI